MMDHETVEDFERILKKYSFGESFRYVFDITVIYSLQMIILLYSKFIEFSLVYLSDIFFFVFRFLQLQNLYNIIENSYEVKNKKMFVQLLNEVSCYLSFDPNHFNIILAWVTFTDNDFMIIVNKLHFLFWKNKKITMKDLELITKNKPTAKYAYIVFNVKNELYVKSIDLKNKCYLDQSKLLFGNIFSNVEIIESSDEDLN